MNARPFRLLFNLIGLLAATSPAWAVTTNFFNATQTATLIVSNVNAVTIQSGDYRFTYSVDGYWSSGGGPPTGRFFSVFWPTGVQAQAITAGPTTSGAQFLLTRQDAELFAIPSFTAKLLANTFGAGASIEIMPLLNGEDARANPFPYDASGYYGQNFSYTTPELAGYDAYKITLYVDFALMHLTLVDPSIPPPPLDVVPVAPGLVEISWSTNAFRYTLESATNIPATTWNPVTNNALMNGDLFTVQLDTSGPQRLFRLRK